MRILALDFDGVVSDSAPEAFYVALRAYVGLRPRCSLAEVLDRLERSKDRGRLTREEIEAHELYARFVEMMPLGNRAEDYAVELCALEDSALVPDQQAYDVRRAAMSESFLAEFHARFYAERSAFATREPRGWERLLGPYPEFVALLRRRSDAAVLALATAKDRASVERLLTSYGIEDLFPAERVLDKEAGVSKRAHLEVLRERLGAVFEDITFVDDKLNHLEDVASLGVRCALAAWGYNGERERAVARARGFVVCGLGDAERALFDA